MNSKDFIDKLSFVILLLSGRSKYVSCNPHDNININKKLKKRMQLKRTAVLLLTTLLHVLPQIEACFFVHYVVYFKDVPMKYYLEMSQNSSFPYIVHLNEELNLPDNRTFVGEITPVEMSDIKKV